MNFGTLKDVFLDKLIESHTSDEKTGKILYKNFLKLLKENETLKTAFIIYKNLEVTTIKSETAANDYLKENVSFLENFRGEQSLKEQSKKLLDLLEKNNIDLTDIKTKKIHESLENLITIKKSISTIDKIRESKNSLVSWLMSDKLVVSESDDKKYVRDNIDPKKFLDIAVNKFNEKYKDSLSEEEIGILKVLRKNNEESTKELVSKLVKETVTLINDHLNNNVNNWNVKEKLLETKDVVYGMMENNSDFSNKVLKLYELKKNLNN
tara:strand:- start:936 stop:1733 length:798 start_codon:yes stop_codon:yes gene_type:complete